MVNWLTSSALTFSSAIVAATLMAFWIARAPDEPWQMMQAPRRPRSGPPPNSWYSNFALQAAERGGELADHLGTEFGGEPPELLLQGR